MKIVNVTDNVKNITNFNIKTEKLSYYNVYSIKAINSDSGRIEKLRNELKDHMPKEVDDKLLALCEEYAEIFALKVNDFCEQKLS